MLLEVSAKPRVPVQFVLVLRGVDLESIRDVRVDDGNTADHNAHQTRVVRIGSAVVEPEGNLAGFLAAEDGNPVVGLHPTMTNVIAGRCQSKEWKLVILTFGFLNAQ